MYMRHLASPDRAKMSKNEQQFYCEFCDYFTSRKNNYIRHLSSKKHREKASPNVTETSPKVAKIEQKSDEKIKKIYICEKCNKEYTSRNGLWKHKKTCKVKSQSEKELERKLEKEYLEKKNEKVINELVKSQKLLADTQQKMLEHIVENNATSITNNNINNINNSKNIETLNNITINLFLNEHCKDALNLTDFVNNIKYQLEDVLTAGENGHRLGIQNVMLKNLEDMPVTERPIHCKDQKRGVYVVKEDGEWADDSKGTTMTDAMKKISLNMMKALELWENAHPGWENNDKLTEEWSMLSAKLNPYSYENPENMEKEYQKVLKEIGRKVNIKDAISEIKK